MKKTRLVLLPLMTLLAAGGPANAAEAKQAISHETLWLLKQVGAPAPSPDGRWVLVPVTEPAYDEKDEIADLTNKPGRKPLDTQGRKQPCVLPGSPRVAGPVARAKLAMNDPA